jgi:hypothetical protein
MKHLVQVALGVLFFATSQMIYSRIISIKNLTPYKAYVGAHYGYFSGGRVDNTVIAPGGGVAYVDTSREDKKPDDHIKRIEGVLTPVEGDRSKNILIREWNRTKATMSKSIYWVHIKPDGLGNYIITTNLG